MASTGNFRVVRVPNPTPQKAPLLYSGGAASTGVVVCCEKLFRSLFSPPQQTSLTPGT